MVKTAIDNLVSLLNKAKEKGCTNVKLQLYEDWKQIEKEQKHPSLKPSEYLIRDSITPLNLKRKSKKWKPPTVFSQRSKATHLLFVFHFQTGTTC